MPVVIDLNTSDFKKLHQELVKAGSALPVAVSAALNRTLDFMATAANKIIRETYTVKAEDVKKSFKKNKSSQRKLSAVINVTGHTLSLYRHFRTTPVIRPSRMKRYKVMVTVKKGQKKQITTIPSAFVPIAGSPPSKRQIFAREGAKRLPIVALHTLSIPQMVSGDAKDQIEQASKKKLEERIMHEIDWRLKKASDAMAAK